MENSTSIAPPAGLNSQKLAGIWAAHKFRLLSRLCIGAVFFIHAALVFRTPTLFTFEGAGRLRFHGTERHAGLGAELSKALNTCVGNSILQPETPIQLLDGPYAHLHCDSRPRYLTFFFDLVDAKAVVALNSVFDWGCRSITHWIFLIVTVWQLSGALALFRSKAGGGADGGSPQVSDLAVASLFALLPQVVLHGTVYYRPAKMIVVAFCAYFLRVLLTDPKRRNGLALFSATALFLLADEMALPLTLLSMASLFLVSGRKSLSAIVAQASAILCFVGFLAFAEKPLLLVTEAIEVSRGYSDPSTFLTFPGKAHFIQIGRNFGILLQSLAGLSWYPRMAVAVPCLVLILGFWAGAIRKAPGMSRRWILRFAGVLLFVVAGHLAILGVMALRHPPVIGFYALGGPRDFEEVVRSGAYYHLPIAFVLSALLLLPFRVLLDELTGLKRLVVVVIALAFSVAQVLGFPRTLRTLQIGHLEGQFREVSHMRESLVNGTRISSSLEWVPAYVQWLRSRGIRTI